MDLLDYYFTLKIALFLISILFLLFFSSAELLFFSADKKRIIDVKSGNKITEGFIQFLLNKSRRLYYTLQITSITSLVLFIISNYLFLSSFLFINKNLFVFAIIYTLLTSILLFVLQKALPIYLVNNYFNSMVQLYALPIFLITLLFYPISKIIIIIVNSLYPNNLTANTIYSNSQNIDSNNNHHSEISNSSGEHELIHSIVSFKSVTAREIMTPRVDIVAVSMDDSFEDLMKLINDSGHSRIPLYQDNLDEIKGIIYAKDLLPYLQNPNLKNTMSLKNIARDAFFVPSSKLINNLLHDFQEKKIHLGVVVDEYGGTAGLISLEDVLEEIVGEIKDEYDKSENEILKVGENSFVVLGKLTIDELNKLLEKDFSSENNDYDTLGGFVFYTAGIIPKQGFSFTSQGYRFTVKEVLNKRIGKVLIESEI